MRFTQAQKQLWLDQGYLVGDKLLEDAELDALGEAFLTTIDRLRRENRLENVKSDDAADDAKQVFQIRTAHLAHPLFEGLIRDTRLLDAIESLIGPNIRLVHFQGLYKPPHTAAAWTAPGRLLFRGQQEGRCGQLLAGARRCHCR